MLTPSQFKAYSKSKISLPRPFNDALELIVDYIESRRGNYSENTLGDMLSYEAHYEDEEDYEDDYDHEDYYDDDDEEDIYEGRKKKKCKPSKGKRFAKRVNGKCRSFGQKGKASDGGDRIRPGTKKAHAYCARSAKIKKCKNPPCANTLSRRKWKCQGSRSVVENLKEIFQRRAGIIKS